jgi:hypothetical protein
VTWQRCVQATAPWRVDKLPSIDHFMCSASDGISHALSTRRHSRCKISRELGQIAGLFCWQLTNGMCRKCAWYVINIHVVVLQTSTPGVAEECKEWCSSTLAGLNRGSPRSLAVAASHIFKVHQDTYSNGALGSVQTCISREFDVRFCCDWFGMRSRRISSCQQF